jgi:hypothetical protein
MLAPTCEVPMGGPFGTNRRPPVKVAPLVSADFVRDAVRIDAGQGRGSPEDPSGMEDERLAHPSGQPIGRDRAGREAASKRPARIQAACLVVEDAIKRNPKLTNLRQLYVVRFVYSHTMRRE